MNLTFLADHEGVPRCIDCRQPESHHDENGCPPSLLDELGHHQKHHQTSTDVDTTDTSSKEQEV